MSEWFAVANSFAAPFVSDQSTHYVEAETAEAALEKLAVEYRHPFGLYAADAFPNADAYHKRADPVARWRSNHELALRERTKEGSASIYVRAPGDFDVNGERVTVDDPKVGKVVAA